jgi:hypothetical protein
MGIDKGMIKFNIFRIHQLEEMPAVNSNAFRFAQLIIVGASEA